MGVVRTFGERLRKHLRVPSPICDYGNTPGHHISVDNFSQYYQGPSRRPCTSGSMIHPLIQKCVSSSCPTSGIRSYMITLLSPLSNTLLLPSHNRKHPLSAIIGRGNTIYIYIPVKYGLLLGFHPFQHHVSLQTHILMPSLVSMIWVYNIFP